jgi:hypothetical protein
VSNAKKNADQIVAQAKAQADQLLSETKADADRRRVASQREVDELTRQKDNITTHLAQVRQLLGGQLGIQLPPMDAAMTAPAPVKPAVESPPPVASAPVSRPAGNGTAPRPAGANGEAKDDDENWWTE